MFAVVLSERDSILISLVPEALILSISVWLTCWLPFFLPGRDWSGVLFQPPLQLEYVTQCWPMRPQETSAGRFLGKTFPLNRRRCWASNPWLYFFNLSLPDIVGHNCVAWQVTAFLQLWCQSWRWQNGERKRTSILNDAADLLIQLCPCPPTSQIIVLWDY